jgi:hypothetical protein
MIALRVFLKSLSMAFWYTDFADNTEKSGFLKDFFRARSVRANRVVRVLKSL